MTHVWTVTTGWHYESTCGVTFVFNNEVSARTVAHEIDTVRIKHEVASEALRKLRRRLEAARDEFDWAEYNQYREECPLPPDDYVLEATGQKIPVRDFTVIQGPLQVLS